MKDSIVNALRYIVDADEVVTVEMFDHDHEPVGPLLRQSLEESALIWTREDGTLALTDLGKRGLRALGRVA